MSSGPFVTVGPLVELKSSFPVLRLLSRAPNPVFHNETSDSILDARIHFSKSKYYRVLIDGGSAKVIWEDSENKKEAEKDYLLNINSYKSCNMTPCQQHNTLLQITSTTQNTTELMRIHEDTIKSIGILSTVM